MASIKLGPERTIHFHTTSSPDLGLTLTHTPSTLAMGVSTGYVRITSINSDGGMVTGDVRMNDVIVEAAGVNMRRPISEGMWKLTLGLMEVAPLPLEIVVAQELDEATAAAAAEEENGKLTNQDTGVDEQQGYYQLETPNKYNVVNDPVLSAKLYQLEGSCDFASPDKNCPVSPLPESPNEQIETRNPYLDEGRFGPERTVVFRTESLGVKLHRSANEGIVHILHVTSYTPPENSTALAPREGEIQEGDAIMEVGGVDLRHQFIGRLEWADMVHFIRYVERPLEMVVASDGMFSREKMGLTVVKEEKDVYDVVRESVDLDEKKEETDDVIEDQKLQSEEKKEESTIDAIEANATEALRDLNEDCNAITNVCDTMADGLCRSPGAEAEDVNELCDTPVEKTEIKPVSPVAKVSPANVKKDNSWIKSPDEKNVSSPSRSPLAVFPRTHPLAERNDDGVSSGVKRESGESMAAKPASPAEESKPDEAEVKSPESTISPSTKSKPEDICDFEAPSEVVDAPVRKSVAELKDLFSPIKVPDAPKTPKPVSTEEQYVQDGAAVTEEAAQASDVDCENAVPSEPMDVDPVSADGCTSTNSNNEMEESVADLEKTIDFDAMSPVKQDDKQAPTEQVESENVEQSADNVSECSADVLEENSKVKIEESEPTSAENKELYAQDLEATPEKPFDETANSSLHEELVSDLAIEFTSPSQKLVQPSDSRDDTEHKKHRDAEPKKKEIKEEETESVIVCAKPVKKPLMPSKQVSTPAPTGNTFKGLFVMDDTDSPFCGNIKFSHTPKDRVPASALFSQAFVVQRTGEETDGTPITDNIRWELTNSPLFVIKKGSTSAQKTKTPLGWSPNPEGERTPPERLFPDPLVAFDMSELDTSVNISDDGSLSDDPSYNPNDTIVYADETDAQANCCAFDTFCADNGMFEGLVNNGATNIETQRLTKEKANKVPSPRRKNLLSRLRKGNKKTKDKISYGNLDDELKESMKGIKKAHVQLRKQNLYGKSIEAATQYASMSDMIEI